MLSVPGWGRSVDRRLARTTWTAVGQKSRESRHLDWTGNEAVLPAQLGLDGAFVDHKFREKNHWTIRIAESSSRTPSSHYVHGARQGCLQAPDGGSPVGPVTISNAAVRRNYPSPEKRLVS